MVPPEIEYLLLGGVLDGLDDLYDQRERAEWWLERLLIATSYAMSGTPWEKLMMDSARALERIRRSAGTDPEKNAQAVAATNDLRVRVADRWGDLDAPGRP